MENNTETIKYRIEFIDAMRGFTMILVVYWHLSLAFGLQKENFNEIFLTFRMPLFFFVSGFFGFATFTKTILKKKLYNRIFGQLIPTLIVGSIFFLSHGIEITDALYDINKRGYWFTITLFEIFIVYACLKFFIDQLSIKSNIQDIIFILLIVLFSILTIPSHALDQYSWWKLLSGFWFVKYTPFFFFGVIIRKHLPIFIKYIHNKYLISICIILFLTFIILPSTIGRALQAYLGILIVFSVFEKYQHFFNQSTYVGNKLSIIGKQTLPIYLLHYFLLDGVLSLSKLAQTLSLNNSWITGCLITSVLSLLIISICLMIEKTMKVSTILHSLLFGFKK